jgi:hypothetical protein
MLVEAVDKQQWFWPLACGLVASMTDVFFGHDAFFSSKKDSAFFLGHPAGIDLFFISMYLYFRSFDRV